MNFDTRSVRFKYYYLLCYVSGGGNGLIYKNIEKQNVWQGEE